MEGHQKAQQLAEENKELFKTVRDGHSVEGDVEIIVVFLLHVK